MILPTKHISTEFSFIGVGAELLKHIEQPQTVSSLWESVKEVPGVATFERFSLALDLLYAIGLVSYSEGLITRGVSV